MGKNIKNNRMNCFRLPEFVIKHNYRLSPEDVPEEIFGQINDRFKNIISVNPLVSINIIARNEEDNILRTLSSLSAVQSEYPLEIIVVDNDSDDDTALIIRRCGLEPVFEQQHGYGFARRAALENSKGRYILTGDADTVYPPRWVDTMVTPLVRQEAIATYGTYSFIPPPGKKRFPYAMYETLRKPVHFARSINRPALTVGGVNFCFPRQEAMEIGFARDNHRSEDGRMAAGLARKGKLKRITKRDAVAWTVSRSVDKDTGLISALLARVKKEMKRIHEYFYRKQ
jgi:glycosyltransferase involved in cell wall biosynthesis